MKQQVEPGAGARNFTNRRAAFAGSGGSGEGLAPAPTERPAAPMAMPASFAKKPRRESSINAPLKGSGLWVVWSTARTKRIGEKSSGYSDGWCGRSEERRVGKGGRWRRETDQ